MAEKRMFTQKIIDSDAFLEMPLSAQALYFHLNMRADDDGFVNNPKKITRCVSASDDDLRLLLAKRFIIGFESGVIVIKHWRMHNSLRADRYKPTDYQEELAKLGIKENKAYTDDPAYLPEPENAMATNWQPIGNQLDPQNRIDLDKSRLEEKRKDKNNIKAFAELAGDDTELLKALNEFSDMRKRIRKPLTEGAITRLINKLKNTFPANEWTAVLNQSTDHCWQDIYPLKDNGTGGKTAQMLHESYDMMDRWAASHAGE